MSDRVFIEASKTQSPLNLVYCCWQLTLTNAGGGANWIWIRPIPSIFIKTSQFFFFGEGRHQLSFSKIVGNFFGGTEYGHLFFGSHIIEKKHPKAMTK